MKKSAITILCLLTMAAPLAAQTASPVPLGVWRGTLDGLPGVTLTLASDAGEIGGTVVFNAVGGEPKRVLFVEPHLLLSPRLEGSALTFQMKLGGDRNRLATVKVIFNSETKAQLHCLDCGSDSPTAELIKQTE